MLALKALSSIAERGSSENGAITVRVNGGKAARLAWTRKDRQAVRLSGLGALLSAGKNTIAIEGSEGAPYSVDVSYHIGDKPRGGAPIGIATSLSKSEVAVGEGVTLRAKVRNRQDSVLPMTLVRIGIPSGLRVEPKELESLKQSGVVDFIETRPREVTIYYRSFAAKAHKRIDVRLIAETSGKVTAAPSSVALYYKPEEKSWAAPLSATIAR